MKYLFTVILSVIFTLIFSSFFNHSRIGMQNVYLRKYFSDQRYENNEIIFQYVLRGSENIYYLEKNTDLVIRDTPFDLICHIVLKNKSIKGIRINQLSIQYNSEASKEYIKIPENIKKYYPSSDNHDITIWHEKLIDKHLPFHYKIDVTLFYKNGEEKNVSFELNFTSGYEGKRNYGIIDAFMSA